MVSLSEEDMKKVVLSFEGQRYKVMVWQKDEEGVKRNVQDATLSGINWDKNEITVDSEHAFTSALENAIYVFNDRRQVVFKATILNILANKMVLKFPESLILPNTRTEDRTSFFNQKIFLHFSLQEDVKASEMDKLHKVQIIDLSPSGVSFKASVDKNFGLQRGDRIWLKLSQSDELTQGTVMHMTVMKKGCSDQYVQVGVKFK